MCPYTFQVRHYNFIWLYAFLVCCLAKQRLTRETSLLHLKLLYQKMPLYQGSGKKLLLLTQVTLPMQQVCLSSPHSPNQDILETSKGRTSVNLEILQSPTFRMRLRELLSRLEIIIEFMKGRSKIKSVRQTVASSENSPVSVDIHHVFQVREINTSIHI